MTDTQYIFNLKSGTSDGEILFNGESKGYSPKTILLTLKEVQDNYNGRVEITFKKTNYISTTRYELTLDRNPAYDSFVVFQQQSQQPAQQQFQESGAGFDPTSDSTAVYSNIPQFILKVNKYENNDLQEFNQEVGSNLIDLDFNLNAEQSQPGATGAANGNEDDDTDVVGFKVALNGLLSSAKFIVNKSNEIVIDKNASVYNFKLGDMIEIVSTDLTKFRITEIIATGIGVNSSRKAENDFESLKLDVGANIPLSLSIATAEILPTSVNRPSVTLIKEEQASSYNINTSVDHPIGIQKNTEVDSLRVVVKDEVLTFSNLSTTSNTDVILIPKKYLSTVGRYNIQFIPRYQNTDGEPIDFILNVVNEVWVGIPDIKNIIYPSVIEGPDYVGSDVDFEIGYESVDTDWVKITLATLLVDGQSSSFVKGPSTGKITLNVKKLLELSVGGYSENETEIDITLNLIPYNESGIEVITGKTETLQIKFLKSSLTIPRNIAVNRIADGFVSQFESNILQKESSKYLTHALHLGDGDNKVITTWTGSEGSLILKLYEPLPTSVQPNQQVWISKYQSNPVIETITVSGLEAEFCSPLKGPNFALEPDNGIGYNIYDELIASGSETSNDLVLKYLKSLTIDTGKLNIDYASVDNYLFENFVNFGSAEERINNFFYKIKLIENYQTRLQSLSYAISISDGSLLTEDIYLLITEFGDFSIDIERITFSNPSEQAEANKIIQQIYSVLKSFDGFEKYLLKASPDDVLGYPKDVVVSEFPLIITPSIGNSAPVISFKLKPTDDVDVMSWYEFAIDSASEFDKYNSNYIVNNIPEFIYTDINNADFLLFLDMIGQHFDAIWVHINGLTQMKVVDEAGIKGIPKDFVLNMLKSLGWNGRRAFDSQFLWEYALGQNKDGSPKYSTSLEDANNQVWRRILNNLPYLLKHKVTSRAMKAIMACYGVPQYMLTIMEFGGPQDPTKGGVSEFTFDDRTAALRLEPSASVIIPWKTIPSTGLKPQGIEFLVKPNQIKTSKILQSDTFEISFEQTTGSFVRFDFALVGSGSIVEPYIDEPFISASVVTYYFDTSSFSPFVLGPSFEASSIVFPLSTQYYSNILINKIPELSGAKYELSIKTSNGEQIIADVKLSIVTSAAPWESGSYISIGNDFDGNIDEVRLWRVPLQDSKFENHTLFPDAINGNSISSSTEDLMFRLDFEYPKDRILDPYIKNVAITQAYGESFATASNFYSASNYPYQYFPYERTVTAKVPSLGFNVSNKIRFEDQELVTELSYKHRATKKAFDRAPIDSNRLGLFLSPIKELNMDIVKAFGDFNIDNYIGNPADQYKAGYRELDTLREYYFERLNLNVSEYIQLVKYINKSLFDVLGDLAPARAKISKGLLIEPHYLERSKVQWNKPSASNIGYDAIISVEDVESIEMEYNTFEANIDEKDDTIVEGEYRTFLAEINEEDETLLTAETAFYDGAFEYITDDFIVADIPTYEGDITYELRYELLGELDTFGRYESVGNQANSMDNLGFGLYAEDTTTIWKRYDFNSNYTESRANVYLVESERIKNVLTQVSGYPRTGAAPDEQVEYALVPTPFKEYVVSLLPYPDTLSVGGNITNVTPLRGYFPTHYKFKNNLYEGLQRSFYKGSVQSSTTTPDGLSAVETFTTNPNILRVANTGRGSGEPILIVD
jgi:hypothetical protein